MNKILYRNLVIESKDLISGNCVLNHAATGENLIADTLDFRLWTDTGTAKLDGNFITKDGDTLLTKDSSLIFKCLIEEELTDFIPGDAVYYYYQNVLVNKFYLNDVKRAGRFIYEFSCISAIGILENSMHYGGMYSGVLLSVILAEILEGIPYTIDSLIGNIKIYGRLPYATKRDNLQQLTIATALAIKTQTNGNLHITALSSDVKGYIEENRVVVGGNIEVGTPATAVQVTEHSYQTLDEEIVLFNESFFTKEMILFSEPVHSLTITGGTILSSNANHAIVQGGGTVTLKGKKYLHNIKKITVGTILNNSKDNIITVENATLITSLNSKAVADKLFEVFSKPKLIKNPVLQGNEKPGDVARVLNPYTLENEIAYIKKMDMAISNVLVSTAEFLSGYTPSGVITGYKNRVLVTSGTSWTVPAGVTEIRAVIIGGGQGGQAGFNGERGGWGDEFPQQDDPIDDDSRALWLLSYNGDAGDGGSGGVAGDGGKIVDTGPLVVTPGAVMTVSIGSGGSGGASNGAAGSVGGDTVFGLYSSANGEISNTGYVDTMTSAIYGVRGYPGFKGQMGVGKNSMPSPDMNDVIYKYYDGDGFSYRSRRTGYIAQIEPRMIWAWYGGGSNYSYAIAGGGGGSSYTSNGGDSQGADWSDNNGKGFLDGGDGGDGAAGGSTTNASIYGGGGYGGHGGGGGGGGGASSNHWATPSGGGQYWQEGSGGQGGAGGAGSNGRQGCIIIYY